MSPRRPVAVAVVVALGLALPGPALACSGPGAAESIARAEVISLATHLLAVALMLAGTWISLRRRTFGGPVAAGWFLVLAHPNLWGSARGGDCGQQLQVSSLLFTTLVAGLLLYLSVRPSRPLEPPAEGGDEDDELGEGVVPGRAG